MSDRIADIRERVEQDERDAEDLAIKAELGVGEWEACLTDDQAERRWLLTRYEEARKVVRFYADPASVKESAKWSDGYPGGIVYEESGDVVIDTGEVARKWLEGEGK